MRFLKLVLTLAVAVLLIGGCFANGETDGGEPERHDGEHAAGEDDEQHEAGVIRLTQAQLEEFGIEIEQAAPGVIDTVIELPGEVRPNQDRLAHIVPRFAGIATEVRKRIGDSVRRGDVLAIVESSESLAPFSVKTSIAGVVIQKHITLGEAVSPDRDIFVIADLRDVWIDLSVYQMHLPALRLGQSVLISGGLGLPEARGEISYIAPVIEEATRTATSRVVLPNPDGGWKPGMFVTGMVTVESTEVPVAVPTSALQTLAGRSVVFVQDEDSLERRDVTTGRADRTSVEILEGLVDGDRYVSRGSFILKSELEKGAFEAGHGH